MKDLESCIAALTSIDLIHSTYASTRSDLIAEVAKMLALRKSELGKYGGICQQVADAIHRGILNQEPPAA
jgi:hypothetical protein